MPTPTSNSLNPSNVVGYVIGRGSIMSFWQKEIVLCVCLLLSSFRTFATTIFLASQEEITPSEIVGFRANESELDLNSSEINARGNVFLTFKDTWIQSENLNINWKTGNSRMNNNVEIKPSKHLFAMPGEIRLRGHEVQYNLYEGKGAFIDASFLAQHNNVTPRAKAEIMTFKKNSLTLHNCSVTLCNASNPHWEVHADSIHINERGRAAARHLRLRFLGMTSPAWPKRSLKLWGKRNRDTFKPIIHFNSVDGMLIGLRSRTRISRGPYAPQIKILGGVSLRHVFRGGGQLIQNLGIGDLKIHLSHHDRVEDEFTSDLFLDRLPEVTFETRQLALGGPNLHVGGSIGWGNFREQLGSTWHHAERRHATLSIDGHLRKGSNPPRFQLFVRKAWYDNDRAFRTFGLMVENKLVTSNKLSASIRLLSQATKGLTPFEFDDVDISTEIRLNSWFRIAEKWRLLANLRYDLSHGLFVDEELGIAYKYHCFEVGLKYDTARREFGFLIGLPQ